MENNELSFFSFSTRKAAEKWWFVMSLKDKIAIVPEDKKLDDLTIEDIVEMYIDSLTKNT